MVFICLIYLIITKGSFNEDPIQLFTSILNILVGISLIEKSRRAKKNIPIVEGYNSVENFKDGKKGLYTKRLKTNSCAFAGVLLLPILFSIY